MESGVLARVKGAFAGHFAHAFSRHGDAVQGGDKPGHWSAGELLARAE